MHQIAEYGIAAHWKYKEGIKSDTEEVKLSWLRQALEWQKDISDPREFMESLKMDLFSSQVFVFTPQGDVIDLPAGSTPLDFAFKIHTDVGCKCVGAKVNGKMVTIDYPLENGNIIEIVTSPNAAGPSIDWLKIARSSSARNKIRQWLKRENRNDAVDKGKDLFDKYLRKKGNDPKVLLKNSYLNRVVKELNFKNQDELFTQLSYGGNFQSKVMGILLGYEEEAGHLEDMSKETSLMDDLNRVGEKVQKRTERAEHEHRHMIDATGVVVDGVDNLLIQLGRCCRPVPGDDIVGFITKGRGITVHRRDCDNLRNLTDEDRKRMIEVSWDPELLDKNSYNSTIAIIAKDQKGIFSSISKICEDMDVHIVGIHAEAARDETIRMDLTVGIHDREQVEKMCRSLKNVPGIIDAYRSRA